MSYRSTLDSYMFVNLADLIKKTNLNYCVILEIEVCISLS